jgi:membrane-bound lytic murein transglycosylase B
VTPRATRRCTAALLLVVAVAAARPAPLDAAPSVRAQGDGAAAPQVPAAGIGLTPEVAAVPASSPELDAAETRLDELVRARDDQTEELAATDAELAADTAASTAVRALAARRTEQVAKAAAVDDRTRRALTALMVDRFVEGDHLLEGLDPMLSAERRDELGRQMVLGEVGTDRLMAQRRHTTATLEELQGELEEYTRRAAELDERIADLDRRGSELRSSLDALGPRIDEAGRRRDAARGAATIDGTDMSVLALDAYWRAAQYVALTDPTCRLSWPVLAGIGRTESRHGTYRGAVLGADGVVAPPIYGPELDGSNTFAVVPDSDGGGLDGTARTDRAVGPMQFLPGTWRTVGTDLTGDGDADPQNLYDAAAAAGVYLCRSGPGLDDAATRRAAVLTYNRSQEYADIVDERAREYAAAVPLS